mmetsp:Transcript_22494/g.10857  ORF Transcript_22494/g.10857 Transcript_22494/m.10857 type:complete len:451 (-) Transcript_22494:1636-2988(-)
MFPSILIVDDEDSIRHSLEGLLFDEGFDVITASNGYDALKLLDSEAPDLVLLDIWMPGIDGIETLKEIKKSHSHVQVIIITGHGSIETAVTATKIGAFDFIEKPLSIDRVIVAINNALNFRRLEEENKYLRKKIIEKHSIIGNSKAATLLKKQISAAAPTDAWILISGKNGTGKELVARSIHLLSPRAEKPIIDVNCAAISEEYIEIELFGHEKGVVAGSTGKRIGKFELANYGTIFFDEIGDMSLKTQGKILRVLQEQKFTRVGGSRTISLDVRVIAASNKDLLGEIKAGNFREDLYYRINVIPISVPSLRKRIEDLPVLVEALIEEHNAKFKKKKMTQEALQVLKDYTWPGNVRELKNLIERLVIMVEKKVLDKADIPPPYNPKTKDDYKLIKNNLFKSEDFRKAKLLFEREFIKRNFEKHSRNISKTAKAIGISKDCLAKKVKKFEI